VKVQATKPAAPSKAPVKKAAKATSALKTVKAAASGAKKPTAVATTKVAGADKLSAKPAKPVGSAASAQSPKNLPRKALPSPVKSNTKSTPVAASAPPKPAATANVPPPAPKPARTSRLAQLTVPSMAQSVASTAAKASYSQVASPPAFVPPPHVAVKKDPKLANNWKTKPPEELSDAEVLAMPDAEYMNDKQLAFFKHKLTQLKQEILNSAGETTEHLREDTVIVPDPADRATIEEEHALELRTRDRERKLLKKIEQSIGRIDAGDYGYCDETGESIGVGRLLARPTATLSLEAQQRRELKQKMFGD